MTFRPTLKGVEKTCDDCRRPILCGEALFGGKCRICSKIKNPWLKATMPTPTIPPLGCFICKGVRDRDHSYCSKCMSEYGRRRYELRKQRARQEREALERRFSGVDIDAVHRNPRWAKSKLKKAA